jgi:hypothetical protein
MQGGSERCIVERIELALPVPHCPLG